MIHNIHVERDMFVDEVITDLKKYELGFEIRYKGSQYLKTLPDLYRDLASCEKFYLGADNDLVDLSVNNYWTNKYYSKGTPFLNIPEIRLPYRKCWFSFKGIYEGGSYKRGIFAKELAEDVFNIRGFVKVPKAGDWGMFPGIYTIAINKTLDEMRDHPILSKADFTKDYNSAGSRSNTIFTPLLNDRMDVPWEELERDMRGDIYLLEKVLLLLSCKNVDVEKVMPPEKVNRKRRRRGKLPLFSYHVLVLKPTGKKEESIPKDLWHNRIHLCRGHFKEYTEENPLFGKHVGRYWWQPYARGQNKSGVVFKDYEMNRKSA